MQVTTGWYNCNQLQHLAVDQVSPLSLDQDPKTLRLGCDFGTFQPSKLRSQRL